MHNLLAQEKYIRIINKILVILMAILIANLTASAQNDLCISQIDFVTGSPIIDGVVYAVDSQNPPIPPDVGWTRATRFGLFAFDRTQPTKDGFGEPKLGDLQIIRDTNNIYLSYYIQSPAPDVGDTIVLEFHTDGNAAHDWRIEISPFDSGVPADNKGILPSLVHFWRDSGDWNKSTAVRDPGGIPVWLDATPLSNPISPNIRLSKFPGAWALELMIPWEKNPANAGSSNGIYFPATGTFNFYADILAANTLLGNVAQVPWPVTSGILPAVDNVLNHNTPDSSNFGIWGTATFDAATAHTACTGLSVNEADIGVLNQLTPAQPGGTNILRFKFGTPEVLPTDCTLEDNTNPAGPINHLFANVHNSMSKDAPDVKTTFRFANWGIPPVDPSVPAWALAGGTPSAGLVNPPNNQNPTDVKIVTNSTPAPAIGATFQLDWELTRRQSCDFAKGGNIPGNGHFCMLAEIQSSDPGVHFVNNAARRNMNFVTLSAFSDTAEISAVGYKGPIQEFMLTVDHEVRSYRPTAEGSFYCESSGQTAPPKTATTPTAMQNKVATTVISSSLQRDEFTCIRERAFPKGLTQAMIWVARGYRKTGEFLIINNRKYELVDGVGGFGYVAGHNGPVAKWTQELTGDFAPSDPKAKDEKLIEITTGQTKIVNVRIEAKEQRESKFAVFADLGVGTPNGAFGNVFDPGFSLNGGLEYIINPHFSAEGILGYHHFPSKGVGDVNVFQFTGGGKVYSPPFGGNNFAFARAGLGGYHFSFSPGSTTNFGGYVGGGLLHEFNPNWGVEGVYTFHTVNTPGTATRFSTVQGGVRYVFP